MSHFTCLIIGENVETQLEPFWELDLSPEEAEKDPRSEFTQEFSLEEAEKGWKDNNNKYPENFYDSVDEYMTDYYGYAYSQDEKCYGYFQNPNAQWDWFTIGGRWSGMFKINAIPEFPNDTQIGDSGFMSEPAKQGFCDSIRLCDIDFEGMKEKSKIDNEKYWEEAFKKYPKDDQSHLRTMVYGIKNNQTKEQYINSSNSFSTFAILNDGEWSEKDNEENWKNKLDSLIKELPKDTRLTIVDCHI